MTDFGLLNLELLVCALAGVICLLDLFLREKDMLHTVAAAGVFGILLCSVFSGNMGTAFFGAYVSDGLSIFFKIIILASVFLSVLVSIRYLKNEPSFTGEYYVILLLAALGMLLMASSREMITLYVSLELLSISSYILSAFHKNSPESSEAGIKYLLFGGVSSSLLLLGMGFVYGAAGSTYFSAISARITMNGFSPLLLAGLVFIIAGLGFKVAVVPFHMWVPDVYEGAPAPVAAFFSVATKIAGFAVLVRLFYTCFDGMKSQWGPVLLLMSAVTMVAGNLAAIPQSNIRRLMGYSGVAQAGYLLIGIASLTCNGLAASLFYLCAYLFSNLLAFTVITVFSGDRGDGIEGYRGMAKQYPLLALSLLISFMSLGGIPPFAGFIGKIYLFLSAWESGHPWLLLTGAVMSVVSVFYYLTVLKRVYIEAVEPISRKQIDISGWEKIALGACLAGTLALGLAPSILFGRIKDISAVFFK